MSVLQAVLYAVLIVPGVSFLLTSLLLPAYLWNVEKLMRSRGLRPEPEPEEPPVEETGPEREYPSESYNCSTPLRELKQGAPKLFERAKRAYNSAGGVYVLAGGLHIANVLLVLFLAKSKSTMPGDIFNILSPYGATTVAPLLWPVLETQLTLSGAGALKKAAGFLTYLIGLWLMPYIVHDFVFNIDSYKGILDAGWVFILLSAPTLTKWAVMNSWLKAAGTTVLVTCAGGAGGLLAALWLHNTKLLAESPTLFYMLGTYLLFIGFGIGWLSVKWLVSRHAGKTASDQTIILDIYWLMLAEWMAFVLVLAYGNWYGLLALTAFIGYCLVLTVGFQLRKFLRRNETENIRLLVLRTFTKSNPKEPGLLTRLFVRLFGERARWLALSLKRVFGGEGRQLIRQIETRWRYIGSIQLIAGPDLACAYVDVDEFVDWARGGLGNRFIQTDAELDRQLHAMDLAPDRDGRYRVNEFFCADDMWGKAFDKLIKPGEGCRHAVLMDLRGFRKENLGVLHELGQLVNRVYLERVVFVVDGKTVPEYLERKLREFWAVMDENSPNHREREPALRFFHVDGRDSKAAPRLLALLLRAAEEGAEVESKALAQRSLKRDRIEADAAHVSA